MRAINAWVFVKRDPDIKGVGNIVASDKAHAKNQCGTVVSSGSSAFIEGCTVLLPHYKGMYREIVYNGEELAVVKAEDIIAIVPCGTIRPVNGYVMIRKCTNDHIRDKSGAVALYMTENHIEDTQWVEVLDFAEDVKTIPHTCIGWFCQAPESEEGLQRVGYTKDYMLKAELIEFLTDGE